MSKLVYYVGGSQDVDIYINIDEENGIATEGQDAAPPLGLPHCPVRSLDDAIKVLRNLMNLEEGKKQKGEQSMNAEAETITINGQEYVKKSSVTQQADSLDGMDYCIIRTYSAGVFAGYVKWREGQEVEIVQARRLWYWSGAASLSQLAIDGTEKPKDCKFPPEVPSLTVTQAIEIIPCTIKAQQSIKEVPVWRV